ncbi:MAG: S1 RNA-binding domain-containing protein [Candidatus Thermoplasmatota archaeon]|nr:S1 RNA-binding domain-containing protein [Candidatus Thermoplasmatota archaeon]
MSERETERELLLPGDEIEETGVKPGEGTFKKNGKIYAAKLGVKTVRDGYVNVAAQSGRYDPSEGDKVIGTVTDIDPSYWTVDVNAPFPAVLHVNDVPWRVDYGDTSSYIEVGDALLLRITDVDEQNKMQISIDEEGLRKLEGGQIIEIAPSQVPRIIGRGGSMISMLKKYTGCKIFVGQNGRIWIDGDLEGQYLVIKAIEMIEENAQALGLTDAVENFLKEETGKEFDD